MTIISYFVNGELKKVIPGNSSSYNSTHFVADDMTYNLFDNYDVIKMPIPKFIPKNLPSVTTSQDYILRMVAGNIRDTNKPQSIIVMKKATQLMLASHIGWGHNDYLRLVKWLYEDGFIEEAEKTEKYFDDNIHIGNIFTQKKINEILLKKTFDSCKQLKTNIVVSSDIGACSKEDALIRNRLFTISGFHFRIKKLPKINDETEITFSPFILGIDFMYDRYRNKIKDPIKYSNRPRIDDRTEEEKENHLKFLIKIENRRMDWIIHKQFFYLKYKFPDKCPKSRYALRKLFNENREEYYKLVSILPNSYIYKAEYI